MDYYPARTKSAALTRGGVRTGVLLGLAAVAVWWSAGETSAGNQTFLRVLAALLVGVALWGAFETRRELAGIRRRAGRPGR